MLAASEHRQDAVPGRAENDPRNMNTRDVTNPCVMPTRARAVQPSGRQSAHSKERFMNVRYKAGLLALTALPLILVGCGLESAGTAATAGATKQMELEQARKTQEAVREQVQQSMEQMNKRNEQLDGATQ